MLNVKSVRFRDDIVVLAPTRRWLRKAVRIVNQVLASLRLEKHPEKTFIGRIDRGFDFLGYRFSPGGVRIAKKTVENFVARAIRLYEQEPEEPFDSLSACTVRATGEQVVNTRWVCQEHVGSTAGLTKSE